MRVCSAALAMPKSASFVVHHAGAVGVVEAVAGVADDAHGLLYAQPLALAEHVGAGRAVHVLHDDVVAVGRGVAAGVEHLHHVRVHEPRRRQGLAPEAGHERLVLGQVLRQKLHGHRALEHGVGGLEDRRHATGPEPALEAVAARYVRRGGHPPPGAVAPPPSPPLLVSSPLPPLSSFCFPGGSVGCVCVSVVWVSVGCVSVVWVSVGGGSGAGVVSVCVCCFGSHSVETRSKRFWKLSRSAWRTSGSTELGIWSSWFCTASRLVSPPSVMSLHAPASTRRWTES